MQYNAIKNAISGAFEVVEEKATAVSMTVGTGVMLVADSALAALPADVDTAITAAQADGLAMIGKGFAYMGAIGGLLVVLGLFWKILRKPAR